MLFNNGPRKNLLNCGADRGSVVRLTWAFQLLVYSHPPVSLTYPLSPVKQSKPTFSDATINVGDSYFCYLQKRKWRFKTLIHCYSNVFLTLSLLSLPLLFPPKIQEFQPVSAWRGCFLETAWGSAYDYESSRVFTEGFSSSFPTFTSPFDGCTELKTSCQCNKEDTELYSSYTPPALLFGQLCVSISQSLR